MSKYPQDSTDIGVHSDIDVKLPSISELPVTLADTPSTKQTISFALVEMHTRECLITGVLAHPVLEVRRSSEGYLETRQGHHQPLSKVTQLTHQESPIPAGPSGTTTITDAITPNCCKTV